MEFAGIPGWMVFTLAAAAAAALAVMHLLRVRPRRVTVVTTLFWKPAAERTLARRMFGPFRHPATYALLLLIALLMIFALGEPRRDTDATDGLSRVVVLDAGLPLSGDTTRWQTARQAAIAEASDIPARGQAAVIVANPWPRLLQAFDAPALELPRKLAEAQPGNAPMDHAAALQLAESLLVGRANTEIVLITDQPPNGWNDAATRVVTLPPITDNANILSAVWSPSDATPLTGDLTVRVGWWGATPRELTLTASADAPAATLTQTVPAETTADFVFADLPASGATLTLALSPDDMLPADNTATVTLPLRRPIAISVAAAPPALTALLRGNVETRIVDAAAADLLVTTSATPDALAQPAIIIAADGPALPEAARINPTSATDLDFAGATPAAGQGLTLREGEQALLLAGEVCVAAQGRVGTNAYLRMSPALFSADATVAHHPALATMIARRIRALAGWQTNLVTLPLERSISDPLWLQRHASRAGATPAGVRPLANDPNAATPAPATAATVGWSRGWFEWLLLAALVGLMLEAVLHTRGRIP